MAFSNIRVFKHDFQLRRPRSLELSVAGIVPISDKYLLTGQNMNAEYRRAITVK
jgi:hypothetical protein